MVRIIDNPTGFVSFDDPFLGFSEESPPNRERESEKGAGSLNHHSHRT